MFQFFDPNSLTRKAKLNARATAGLVEIKSKFDAEFRRFSIDANDPLSLQAFQNLLQNVHRINNTSFSITYTDKEGDLLPINNQDNFTHALKVSRPLLRVTLHHANNQFQQQGYGGALPKKNIISRLLEADSPAVRRNKRIGLPENFRYVSAIIDADILPPTQRRVKLIRNNSQKPLGFFVRDGFSIHPTSSGSLERVAGVFISRLVPGGLAEGTGLLAANDEVLEVNGIEVAGKSLDQVTDMMVANSGHLIITIKPCNQFSQITLPQPTNPPLIRSSFNDLTRSSYKESNGKAKALDSRVTCSMHNLNDTVKAPGGGGEMADEVVGVDGVGGGVEEEDDVREFVRRDPSGSSSSNRDSTQLLQQQQQQLEQLKQLTLQKEQLENQLKLQQQQQQYDLQQQQQYELNQEYESQHEQKQQLLLQQQQLQKLQQQQYLQQYELQQQLKQRDTLLPNYNQTDNKHFNNNDIINNTSNISTNNTHHMNRTVGTIKNIENNNTHQHLPNNTSQQQQQNNSWFSINNNNDADTLQHKNTQQSPHNNINNYSDSPFNTPINFTDLQPPTQFTNSPKDFDNRLNNNLQKFSKKILIKDLQSLDQLDRSCYDEENIRFVEGSGYEETDVFGNSSLRINPNSNVRSRLSTRSVDHHMKKRKARF